MSNQSDVLDNLRETASGAQAALDDWNNYMSPEIDELTARVEELEADLAEAMQRIHELERELGGN